jgi:hypothetical protein
MVMTVCGCKRYPACLATDLINLVIGIFPAMPCLHDQWFLSWSLTILFIACIIAILYLIELYSQRNMAQVLPEVALFANVLENVIGFPTAVERARIIAGGITSLNDLRDVKEKDLCDTLSEYEKKPVAQRVSFSTACVNKMIGLMHYVQDCNHIGMDYDIEDITPEGLVEHSSRATVRKSISDHKKTHAETPSLGQLKDEKNWVPWHNQLKVFLGGLLGVTGVPLSYMIRKQEEPDFETEFDSFLDMQAARVPLEGPAFQADARKVHNHIMSFVGGLHAEHWIKGLKHFHNGRCDVLALRDHYQGAGNVSQQIARAENIHETAHYRSEKMLSFEKFLSLCQEMFNIYEDQEEPWTERQKVSFLLEKGKIQAAHLIPSVSALKVEFNRHKGTADPIRLRLLRRPTTCQ